jgi:hypothetical protein
MIAKIPALEQYGALTQANLGGRTIELTHMTTLKTNLRFHLCSVHVHDAFDFNDSEEQCVISKCETTNCKTCNILNTAI